MSKIVNPKQDKYDQAIAYLTKHPEEIMAAWMGFNTHIAGCLFAFLSPSGFTSGLYGCATIIKADERHYALTPTMTEAIQGDDRIPKYRSEITVESLLAFAEYQRQADAIRAQMESANA